MTSDVMAATTTQILVKLQEEFAARFQDPEVREIVQHLVPLAAADIVRQMRGNSMTTGLSRLNLSKIMIFYQLADTKQRLKGGH